MCCNSIKRDYYYDVTVNLKAIIYNITRIETLEIRIRTIRRKRLDCAVFYILKIVL